MARKSVLISLPLLILASGVLLAQNSVSADTDVELQQLNADLYRLEDRLGNMDPGLLEPLEQIADRLAASGRFTEAHAVLDRAQQIARINEGLYTRSQIRFIEKKISNFANAGDWDSARQLQDHLFWLYTRRYEHPDELMIRGLLRAADFHLRGITEDDYRQNSYHYRAAGINARIALEVAESLWRPRDPRFSRILYEQLKHTYLQALAVEKGAMQYNSDALRQRSSFAEERHDRAVERSSTIAMHRQNGLIYLRRLEEIYADRGDPDPEGAAMVQLYRADWEVLFHHRDSALEHYKEAYYALMEAGVPVEQVNELFRQPVLIPESEFHATVEESLWGRRDRDGTGTAAGEPEIPIRLTFSDWNVETDDKEPIQEVAARPNVVLFSFSLNADSGESARRHDSDSLQLGVAQNLALIEQASTPVEAEESLLSRLHWLRFRPKLVNGVPQAVSGVISYLIATGN